MTTRSQNIGIYGALAVAVAVLWVTPFLAPVKILVVFFHELSHAVAGWLTGGEVKEFVINVNQGGHVLMVGGDRFLTLSAGYLGSLVVGAVMLLATGYSRSDKYITAFLGIVLIGVAAGFIRTPFGFIYCAVVGGGMLVAAYLLSHQINDYILHFLAMTNLLYVPLDIYSDTLQRSHLRSDARMLAEEFGGTTVMWGVVWLSISLVIAGITIFVRARMHRSD